eukprot:5582783-Prymnesium_polylepis.1
MCRRRRPTCCSSTLEDTHAGVLMDPLGDNIATEPHTDKRKPHDAVLRLWHAATQTSATHA